ncbi:TerB family tellurite resistance protein [Pelagibacterales bacterium SAG-MED19]|nr:TerB family tellurite resistance protein [Pelagibacterales bacterium SAG-MED19]|tara:strand:+ start:331 stop:744 length:414 start_codon:yes stop_codon:yes gene_type:complete
MFFKENKNKNEIDDLSKVAALLIHAAKIDQNFTEKEEKIIELAILKIGANNQNIKIIIEKGKTIENDSNQILEFTREVKKMSEKKKILVVETLWQIIYSNNEADMYETSLMRRLAGLLYIDNKIMGNIKEKIKNQNL